MQFEESPPEEPVCRRIRPWRWHTEGVFPKDQAARARLRAHRHVPHLAVDLDMVDPDWIARSGVEDAVEAIRGRRETPCAMRDTTEGDWPATCSRTEGRAIHRRLLRSRVRLRPRLAACLWPAGGSLRGARRLGGIRSHRPQDRAPMDRDVDSGGPARADATSPAALRAVWPSPGRRSQ